MILTEEIIDNLPYSKEKVIDKYIAQIGKEVHLLSKEFEAKGDKDALGSARCQINKKYGKWWRDRLVRKKIFHKNAFDGMLYF